MTTLKKAFTLIELLVVIAIIAILAAILFPVFAKAKEAAKVTVALSNLKQIGTSWWMYQSDNDDMFSPRRTFVGGAQPGELSWKQLLHPYNKSTQVYVDPVNPASKYPDDTSDPNYRASLGHVVLGPIMARGYTYYDQAFFVRQNFNALAFSPGELENPANTIAIFEHKRFWVDGGPWLNWSRTESDPILGRIGALGYPWGGKKWEEKAMAIIYIDGHAKRAVHTQICGGNDELNQWNYVRSKLASGYALGNVSWMDTYCTTMPAEVK